MRLLFTMKVSTCGLLYNCGQINKIAHLALVVTILVVER
jgi:hypothetical protein